MLRYLIETHQKTQREVAVGTGLADSTISEILAGKRKLSVKQVEAWLGFSRSRPRFFWMVEVFAAAVHALYANFTAFAASTAEVWRAN